MKPRSLWAAWTLAIVLLGGAIAGFVLLRPSADSSTPSATRPSTSPAAAFLRVVGKQAPGFSLLDQFGRMHNLASFRGKGVLLTFVSSRCTNLCPLTALLLRRTEELLGPRSRETQVLAVNANPRYASVQNVLRWSRKHAMTHRWLFLTGPPTGAVGPLTGLATVWHRYGIVSGGAHTTVIFLIDPQGRVRNVAPIAERASLGAEARALARYVNAMEGG
jgi:protein SCO1/2